MYTLIRFIFCLAMLIATSATAQMAEISDGELAAQISVNGVLVSADNEIALVNDRLVRVGERVGAVEIIAIESGLVHMRAAERAFAMRVGSSLIRESHYADTPAAVPAPAFAPEFIGDVVVAESYGPVAPGETLSEIAESLASDGQGRTAMMTALYEHNPQAFGRSMNVLYAGARLALPDDPGAAPRDQLTADASSTNTPALARNATRRTVQPGDTLSAIAASLAVDSITLNQVMLAIFEVNPHSFGGNLNLLYAFETLDIPDPTAWQRHTPQAAHAEVNRHAAVWRTSAASLNST